MLWISVCCAFQECSLEDVGNLVQSLMGDFYRPLYLKDERYKDLDVFRILRAEK